MLRNSLYADYQYVITSFLCVRDVTIAIIPEIVKAGKFYEQID